MNDLRSRCAPRLLLALATTLFLVGCPAGDKGKGSGKGAESKVTKDNFAKVKDNMPEKEVTGILGDPTETKEIDAPGGGKMKQLLWKNGNDSVTIDIKDGKVFTRQSMFITIK